MARLYADEDFPVPVVQLLRGHGHDVVTVQEAGRKGSIDSQVLADGTADNRAVLTHNHRHYPNLRTKQCTDSVQVPQFPVFFGGRLVAVFTTKGGRD